MIVGAQNGATKPMASRSPLRIVVVVLAVNGLAADIPTLATGPETYVWTGNVDLNWGNQSNWQPTGIPGLSPAGANAVVPVTGGMPGIINASWLSLGDLHTERAVQFGGNVSINTATVTDLIFQNVFLSVADIQFNGTTQFFRGELVGTTGSPAVNNDTLRFLQGAGGNRIIKAKKFTNIGTVDQYISVGLTADGEIHNEGTWNQFENNSDIANGTPWLGGALFKNTGTVFRSPGIGTAGGNFSIPFENQGNVTAQGPNTEITFSHAVKAGGTFTVQNAGHIRFASLGQLQEVESTAAFNGTGRVSIASGPFRIRSGATLSSAVSQCIPSDGLVLDNATANPTQIDGILQNSGALRWIAGELHGSGEIRNSGQAFLSPSQALFVNLTNDGGTVTQTGNTYFGSLVQVNNEPGSTWKLVNGHMLATAIISNRFINRGTFLRDGNQSQWMHVTIPFHMEPGGSVQANANLAIRGGGEFSGGTFQCQQGSIHVDGPQSAEQRVYLVNGTTTVLPVPDNSPFYEFSIGPYADLRLNGGNLVNQAWSTKIDGTISSNGAGEFINLAGVALRSGSVLGQGAKMTNVQTCNIYNSARVNGLLVNFNTVWQEQGLNLQGQVDNHGTYTLKDFATVFSTGAKGLFVNHQDGVVTLFSSPPYQQEVDVSIQASVMFDNRGEVRVEPHIQHAWRLTIGKCAQYQNGVLSGGRWVVNSSGSIVLPGPITQVEGTVIRLREGGGFQDCTPGIVRESILEHGGGVYGMPGAEFTNSDVTVNDGGSLSYNGPCTSYGGTFNVEDESTMSFNGACTSYGTQFNVEDGGSLNFTGPCTNAGGNITLSNECSMSAPSVNNEENDGIMGQIDHVLVIGFTGSTTGQPMLTTPALNNNAILRPGGSELPGPFNLTGTLNQFANGRIHIKLGGATPIEEHDQVRIINGNANLAGALVIQMLDGFTPTTGQTFEVLTVANGTIDGTFANIQRPSGHLFSATYLSDRVILNYNGSTSPADINGDGVVGVSDLLAVINAWGACPAPPPPAGCPADIAPHPGGDGVVNVSDLLMVINNWG